MAYLAHARDLRNLLSVAAQLRLLADDTLQRHQPIDLII
jgi:hypothetical protein